MGDVRIIALRTCGLGGHNNSHINSPAPGGIIQTGETCGWSLYTHCPYTPFADSSILNPFRLHTSRRQHGKPSLAELQESQYMHDTDVAHRTHFSTPPSSSRPLSGVTSTLSRNPLRRLRPHYKVRRHLAIQVQLLTPQGQIAASLASLSRTVDDYSALSKKELIPEKQEKAFERVKNFRSELADYRQLYDRLRKDREDAVSSLPSFSDRI